MTSLVSRKVAYRALLPRRRRDMYDFEHYVSFLPKIRRIQSLRE